MGTLHLIDSQVSYSLTCMPQKALKQLLIPTHLVAVCFRAISQSYWLQDLRTYL